MRKPVLLTFAAVALMPAQALASPDYDEGIADTAREFADPQRQEQLAGMAGAVMAAMLEMPAAPLLRAVAQAAGKDPEAIDPDTRLADLAGPEAADTPREMAEKLPQMMGAMAAFAVALEDMMPQVRALGESVARSVPREY